MTLLRSFLLSSLLLTLACSDPFQEATDANTVDAWEKYIRENPTSRKLVQAEMALEAMMRQAADTSNDIKDYDAYLDRFAEKPLNPKVYNEMAVKREGIVWNRAMDSFSVADWQNYLDEYGATNSKDVREARIYLEVAKYLPNLSVDPIQKKKINLSEASGPLDGWEFRTQFTNNGSKTIEVLQMQISFLDVDGKTAGTKKYTMIGCGEYCGREFVFEDASYCEKDPTICNIKPPMKPGEKRDFLQMTGDTPTDWNQKTIKMNIVGIKFAK